MINRLKRKDRRSKMERSFEHLGMKARHWPATEGNTLTHKLCQMGIKMLPGYEDPIEEVGKINHERPSQQERPSM